MDGTKPTKDTLQLDVKVMYPTVPAEGALLLDEDVELAMSTRLPAPVRKAEQPWPCV